MTFIIANLLTLILIKVRINEDSIKGIYSLRTGDDSICVHWVDSTPPSPLLQNHPCPRIGDPRNQYHLRIWVTILHIAHCTQSPDGEGDDDAGLLVSLRVRPAGDRGAGDSWPHSEYSLDWRSRGWLARTDRPSPSCSAA
jgi:hypothetical protein